jgi:hypothetical protein
LFRELTIASLSPSRFLDAGPIGLLIFTSPALFSPGVMLFGNPGTVFFPAMSKISCLSPVDNGV